MGLADKVQREQAKRDALERQYLEQAKEMAVRLARKAVMSRYEEDIPAEEWTIESVASSRVILTAVRDGIRVQAEANSTEGDWSAHVTTEPV